MSANNQPMSKMNKKDLYATATQLQLENNELTDELNNLKSILKITGQGEFSPAIFDKEYQELLKKKLEFQDKYNNLQKKFTPDKDAMMIANKEIDRLKTKLYLLEDIDEKYEDEKMRLKKLSTHHKLLSDNHNKLIIANKTLIEENEKLTEENEEYKSIANDWADEENTNMYGDCIGTPKSLADYIEKIDEEFTKSTLNNKKLKEENEKLNGLLRCQVDLNPNYKKLQEAYNDVKTKLCNQGAEIDKLEFNLKLEKNKTYKYDGLYDGMGLQELWDKNRFLERKIQVISGVLGFSFQERHLKIQGES
tara:strand:- start:458 stop:1378 length:921 start_codon:yes stop_codon:yes gene_type:complete